MIERLYSRIVGTLNTLVSTNIYSDALKDELIENINSYLSGDASDEEKEKYLKKLLADYECDLTYFSDSVIE